MTTVSIQPESTIILDPSDKRTVVFDWDERNLAQAVTVSASVWTITAIRQIGVTALTKDNESLVTGNRKTQVRLLATTATVGDEYQLSNKVTTSDSPVQEKEQSIRILIQNR
jgi:hypothetical protein